ncbi:phosphoribosylamine--glycine ligase [Arcanobacterium pluranimalium]|uniref:phosphoribosylamine--glycine ligase n=1 Tax=Arcanobacterium pluranimalium TaxID=108028 RepID=UPI0019590C50|nr:phosphoribosylamine--glycine ligase [Arcanobacterium pluranimalium]MBM7824962.1 phosphoribosylamine--glycine ligase [Arcanobacterium pluranimalium]
MKIMIVGGGGREMALVEAVARFHEVVSAGGSDAIAEIASHAFPLLSWDELADEAVRLGVDLTIIGPEAPLAGGIVDVFQARGLPIFGPTQAAAQIESSKAFAKEIMTAAGVPTAAYRVFTDSQAAREYLAAASFPQVLKENGLRAGKGVTICKTLEEADAVLREIELDHENPLLIEDFLEGFEFSLIVMANGTNFVALPVAQDHKPIGEGNIGANTGGMGAISPVPRVTQAIYDEAVERVIVPTLAQMAANGTPFTGFLYAGLIQTAAGVRVIEFNARLGDPECEVILPRIENDLAGAILDLLAGNTPHVEVSEEFCLGIVLSSPGYPGAISEFPQIPSSLLAAVDAHPQAGLTHMGTRCEQGAWIATGGRVAIVTMKGSNIDQCRAELLKLISDGLGDSALYWRRDIGAFAS